MGRVGQSLDKDCSVQSVQWLMQSCTLTQSCPEVMKAPEGQKRQWEVPHCCKGRKKAELSMELFSRLQG